MSIRGIVVDENGETVDYFSTILMSARDSTIINGAPCRDGALFIETNVTGHVLLRLSGMGYDEKYITLDLTPDSELNIGTVVLNTSITVLDGVEVNLQRPAIESRADRIIVNVRGSILADAFDGIEMLRKTPALMVDRDKNVTVFGKGTPIIYVDGKQVGSSQEIEMLNPKNIRTIEIIDNPSAAYDAEGHAVILINTIRRDDIYFVRLGGTIRQARKTEGMGFVEGSWSKSRFRANIYYGYSEENRRTSESGSYTPDDVNMQYHDSKRTEYNNRHSYRFETAYDFSPRQTLGFQSNGHISNKTYGEVGYYRFTDPSWQPFTTHRNLDDRSRQISGTLYYNLNIDSLGQTFRFVGDATRMRGDSSHPIYNILDGASADNPFINTNDNDSKRVLYSLKADYTKPLGKRWTIATGAKYYYIDSDNRTVRTGSINSTQDYLSEEQNIAAYISATTRFGEKISLRYGLRAEYNVRKGWDNGTNYADVSALGFFPNILFDYDISENFNVGISYSKRLSRPTLIMLDPSLLEADSLVTRRGNPDLKSSKSHYFQLSLGIFKNLSIRGGYGYIVDPFYFVILRDEANPQIKNVRYINSSNSRTRFITLIYSEDVFKWWTISTYMGFWRLDYKYIEDGVERNNDRPRWTLNMENTFTLPWKIILDVGFNWNSAGSNGSMYNGVFWNLYSSLRRTFFDNAISISISANDIFRRSEGFEQSVLPGKNRNLYDADSRYVRLSVTYQFGKSRYEYRSRSGSEEELNRLQ